MSGVCQRPGCENPLPPQLKHGHRRKWCSERCRKSQYDRACVDCGARVDGTSPGKATGRCDPCSRAAVDHSIQPRCIAARARRELIVGRWARGDSMREIAAEFGITVAALGVEMVRMRGLGYDLPYRHKPRAAA